jgi:bisphosphoglycerate-independent phosphoglycerate mutase (AlkP superfamily)
VITPRDAGKRIAAIARDYDLSFFEHWPSDRSGHRASLAESVRHLELIDEVMGGLLAEWPERGLLIITSDHGNIEEKDHRQHTLNPVPAIVFGRDHLELARRITSLADIAGVVRSVLGLKEEGNQNEHRF